MKDKLIAIIKNRADASPVNVLSMWVAWLFVALDEAQSETDELLADLRRCETARADAVRERDSARSGRDYFYDIGWKAIIQRDAARRTTKAVLDARDAHARRADHAEGQLAAAKERADAAEKKLAELDADDGLSIVRSYVPTDAEVKAWGDNLEASAVPMSSVKRAFTNYCVACGVWRTPGRTIIAEGVTHPVCQNCFNAPWCDVKEAIQARSAEKKLAAQVPS